ncbi:MULTISPECIES: TonB-dependent siderophore receptor [Pseudoalteromonas]|uniref:TonB-dependent siderophore receptor n=1 Tax=Pseudoalteromonas TaxID=53246 RepID=UPI000580B41E|nr:MULTISPECIES: TonB-dependent siderophore receptor [Pseudoalteromonas]KID38793.1 TonB-dependent receptor [Pseudoalteromonas flavipulchra NCIMB 2033 = ATCC BAA-314]MBD0783553.1 TonB-dependent siderophore receptor [Pseudoalteromonas flavipulchra]MBE0375141.1 iron complex outermembrane recepter protein [Pseudoalteromonas flavipulchra NCIMB 2033 = ATCC BAA-314]RZG13041.1 TonB-dependent siderophore receptor [Pseudoalteromonas sp. CO342X]
MRSFKYKYPSLIASVALALSCSAIAQEQTKQDKDDIEIIEVSPRGLISYVSATASKTAIPIVKTPVSVSVLTAQRISDLGAETLQDAIGYVAGVYNGPYGVDTRGDWSKIRGVDPLLYVDGLQKLFGNYNNTRTNPYALESVEILKGPSSVLYGQGSTGGIVNAVSKLPKADTEGEIWAQVGNYDRKQLALDYNTTFGEQQEYQARAVAMYRDSGTQTDYVDDNTLMLAPSFSWLASDETKITLLANLQRNESGSSTQFFPHEGTILPAKYGQIPSERFVSEPGWDKYDTEQQAITAIVEHSFDLDTHIKFSGRYSDSSSEYRTIYSWPPKFEADKRTVKRIASLTDSNARSMTMDLQFHKYLELDAVKLTMVSGVDYQDADTDSDRGRGVAAPLDLYNPVYGQSTELPTTVVDNPENTLNNKQLGAYAQVTAEVNSWVLNAALRYDDVSNQVQTVGAIKNSQNATTGRIGVLYQFENGIAPYASYSESFKAVFGQKPQGGAYKPLEGEQVELGLKYQPTGTEHLITASIFEIKDKNQIRKVSPEFEVQDGEIAVKGLELEAQLEWQHLDIYAAYSYLETEQDVSPLSSTELYVAQDLVTLITDDTQLSATPKHLASIWATYRADEWLPGLKFGAGIRHVGETYDGSRTVELNGQTLHQQLVTDNFTLVDMMIGYDIEQYQFSLQVDNVSDKTVITSCLFRGDCFYGQRRTISANVKYKF